MKGVPRNRGRGGHGAMGIEGGEGRFVNGDVDALSDFGEVAGADLQQVLVGWALWEVVVYSGEGARTMPISSYNMVALCVGVVDRLLTSLDGGGRVQFDNEMVNAYRDKIWHGKIRTVALVLPCCAVLCCAVIYPSSQYRAVQACPGPGFWGLNCLI